MRLVAKFKKRPSELGISLLRYYHAFSIGQSDRGTRRKCPYIKEKESLVSAYWDGRNAKKYPKFYDIKEEIFSDKKLLTPKRE